jgi:hypothetical protein
VRLNGLYVVAELGMRAVDHPLIRRYRDAILLGSLREDVWYIPGAGAIVEHLSFSHFYRPGKPGGILPFLWPGPRFKANLFYRRAVKHSRAGRRAAAFVQLGRVAHLLTDMSCPVHAHRTVHETDPFEWYVEGNKARLLALPVPHVPDAARASDLVEGMARFTQGYATDATHHRIGMLLHKLGIGRRVTTREAAAQAKDLIPMCGGYAAALYRMFLRDVGAGVARIDDAAGEGGDRAAPPPVSAPPTITRQAPAAGGASAPDR